MSLIERCPHFKGQNVHNTNVIQWNLSILDTLGTGSVTNREVFSFRGQNVHNTNVIQLNLSILLFWTPLGQEVSLIERCPHFRGQNVHNSKGWGNHRYKTHISMG